MVQDEVFRSFVTELRRLEPRIQQLIQEVSAESQERRFNIILNKAGKLIDKFLRYRDRGLLANLTVITASGVEKGSAPARKPVNASVSRSGNGNGSAGTALRTPSRAPAISLRSLPDDRAYYRSLYDPEAGTIVINREHSEFLLAQREDRRCLRYLFSIWVKEYGTDAEKVADEMVGVLAEAEPLLW